MRSPTIGNFLRVQRELDGFIALLQSLGVVVTRPEPMDFRKRFATPEWSSRGFCNSCPRDSMLVIGDEIILDADGLAVPLL